MQELTSEEFKTFIKAKPVAAILFDAPWDVSYRPIVRGNMLQAEKLHGHHAQFGEVDCDKFPELAKSMQILNIPFVAYFRDGKLVAGLIGAHQNVSARLERVSLGCTIGYKDGNDK